VSLIFEALKKLDRERETTGRGFLVVAQSPWPARSRALRLALLALGGGALAGAGAWGAWSWLQARQPATPAPVAGTAAAQPSANPLPPPIWETAPGAAVPRPTAAPRAAAPPVATATASPPPPAAPTPEPSAELPLLVIAPRATPQPAALRLEAISAQDGEPVAIINGQLVRKGERVEGALVLWIGADAVEVEIDGRRRVLGF
jgi:hypothetical protein